MQTSAHKTALLSHSPAETQKAGADLAATLQAPSVVALHGELGSGKTCFVRGMAVQLGVSSPVTSPTYTLVHEFDGQFPLYHIDLYRLHSADDVFSMGITDYLDQGIVAIEWAERAAEILPPDAMHVTLEPTGTPNQRRITIQRPG